MSPIGKVFIVLNLIGAGVFLGFSGSYLQKQSSWKERHQKDTAVLEQKVKEKDAEIDKLSKERNDFDVLKTAAQTRADELSNQLRKSEDDKKRLVEDNRGLQVSVVSIQNDTKSIRDELKAVSERADAATQAAAKYLDEKNIAVNERVNAVNAKEELDRVKAAQEATIAKLTMDNGSLSKERNELGLLVKVAESYGFLRSMAAPNLTGEITNVSNNRLCTVAIRSNEGNVDIADQIAKGSWSFAIYDATGYKGEAVARSYDASVNSVLCDIVLVKGEVKQGDQAKTKL